MEVVKWGPEQQEVQNKINTVLTTQPVLTLYDASKQHALMTDASDQFIGGTLMQHKEDGNVHPVMYASSKCVDREVG